MSSRHYPSDPDEVRWDADGPRLIGRECGDCGFATYPPRSRCPNCGASDLAAVEFDRQATLESYTVVRSPQAGFEAPYAIGFVRLSPGSVRVFSPLQTASFDRLAVGIDVTIDTVPIRQAGETLETWGFTPDDAEGGGD